MTMPRQVSLANPKAVSLSVYLTRLIALCVLPLVMLAAYLAAESVRDQQSERDTQARHIAQNLATETDAKLRNRIRALNMLAISPHMDDVSQWRELYRDAQDYQKSFDGHVIFADRKMQMLFNTRVPFGTALPMLPTPKGRAAAPIALATGKPAVSNSFIGPVANEMLVAIAVPALREGRTTFLFLTTLETRQFQSNLDRVALPAGWVLSLLDGNGEIIASRRPLGFDAATDAAAAERFVFNLEVSPWSAVVEIPRASYRAPLFAAAAAMGFALLLATLVSVLGSKLASRKLITAVAALAKQPSPDERAPNIVEIAEVRRRLDEAMLSRATAESGQRQSEALFEATFEHASVGIALVAPDGHWLRVNRRLCEIVGYSDTELLAKTVQDIIHPDDLDADLAYVRRMLAREIETYSIEKRYLRKNGGIVWIHLTVTLIWKADRTPDYFISVVADIQARKDAERALMEAQAVKLEQREEERLAALNQMEDAIVACEVAESASVALRESEERLTYALSATQEAVWDWNLATGQVKHNRQWCELLGCADEMLEHPVVVYQDLIHPDDQKMVQAQLEAAFRGEAHYAAEYRLRHRDGQYLWVSDHGRVVTRAADGSPLRIVGALADVTQRRKAEAERYLLSEALRQSSHPLLLADPLVRVTYLNPAFTDLFGYQLKDLVGVSVTSMLPASDEDSVQHAAMMQQLRALGTWSGELNRMARDGTRIPTLASLSTIRDDQGELVGFVGSYLDLRPLREREAEVRKLSLAVEQSPESIVITDLHGRIEYVNEAFVRNTGYTRQEVVGQNPRILNSGKTPTEIYAAMWVALLSGQPWQGEFENRRKDGSEFTEHAIVAPLRQADGHIAHYVAVKEDISERKRNAAELDRYHHRLEELVEVRTHELTQAKLVAEAATGAKSAFLANMSHEIRTPLNAIVGLAYLLEREDLPGEAAEMSRKIHIAGRSLLGIINDILDFSKIEAGKIEIERAPFQLSEVLDSLSSIMSANAASKDIDLIIFPVPNGADRLYGDALRLEQVLVNLSGNAIKFTERGHVELAIELAAETEREVTLRFAVRDTGVGISAEKQREIFAPFAQADVSTTRRFGGTGLGLAICDRLVALMGGTFGVISEPGDGSEFWFTLTFERAPEVLLSAPEMNRLNILIADDNPIACAALESTAAGLGWKASTVNSGEAAVEQVLACPADQCSFDVLILDWKMPGMDGLAAARRIREALPQRRQPIIIMITAHLREELLAHADKMLADEVLNKPVTSSSLYDAVAAAQRNCYGDVEPTQRGAVRHGLRLAEVRLLVVDDSDINREVALRIFEDEGARVVLAIDGRQAVDWLLDHPDEIDLVLMDVQMPVMDGYEATRLIRRAPTLANLPVVALSAGVFKEQEAAAIAAGMTGFIAKPFDVEAAIALILKLTGREARPEQMTMPDLSASAPASLDLPGLALRRGLAIWKNESRYRQYLRIFVKNYSDIVRKVAQADRTGAAALAHKLKGAAGSLALEEVAALAADLDHLLRAGQDPADNLVKLQAALDTVQESIARYAPPDALADTISAPVVPGEVAQPISRMLAAFNSDDPDVIEPVLDELRQCLPSSSLAALHACLENFDFRGGEAATRALAVELGISLDN